MDFIVQKAVELGIKKISPLITERCNVRLDAEREEKKLEHWRAVAISACEQSGRNVLPEIMRRWNLKNGFLLQKQTNVLCCLLTLKIN